MNITKGWRVIFSFEDRLFCNVRNFSNTYWRHLTKDFVIDYFPSSVTIKEVKVSVVSKTHVGSHYYYSMLIDSIP